MALLGGAATALAAERPLVTLAVLPSTTTIGEIEDSGGAIGAMSAGLGRVQARQTYLDIGQGARTWARLYEPRAVPEYEPPPASGRIRGWAAALSRATRAPAEIVPGLLAQTIRDAGYPVRALDPPRLGQGVALAADRRGFVRVGYAGHGLVVRAWSARQLHSALRRRHDPDLIVALQRPPPRPGRHLLWVVADGPGIRGGLLDSRSTRLDGVLVPGDLGATILHGLDVAVPSEFEGKPLRSGDGSRAHLPAYLERLEAVAPRRGPVLGFAVGAWVLALLVAVALGGRIRALAPRALGLAGFYLPPVLMLTGALSAAPSGLSQSLEAVLVALAVPALGLLTALAFDRLTGVAVAAGVALLALAIDLPGGSVLTGLSLLGPNPALGARFYGIGNELEAVLAVVIPVGAGALLAARVTTARRGAAWFAGVGIASAALLGAGRLGADVGAAIVMPAAAAAAAVSLVRPARRSWPLLVLGAALAGLAILASIDLVTGGDSHFTGSVLRAGGLDQLGDVAERRLRLSAASWTRPSNLIWIAVLGSAAVLARRYVRLPTEPAARAGLAGAVAGVVVGALVNDSGALVLVVGSAYLAASVLALGGETPAPTRG